MSNRWKLLVSCVAATCAVVASATETRYWVVDTTSEMLAGEGNGAAVLSDGRIVPALPWRSVAVLEEAVLIAGDVAADGSAYLATGFPAKLYRLSRDGELEELTELPAEQATAVLVDDSGAVLIGTAAPASVLRWSDQQLVEVGNLEETEASGVWALASFAGDQIVATGAPAVLFRIRPQGLERWAELPDRHARSLTVANDTLMVGTSGKGMVFRIDGNGRWSLLVDSPFTEISDITTGPEGEIWATAVVGEPEEKKGSTEDSSSSLTDLKLPKVGSTTASSELLKITPDGAVVSVHRFPKQVAMAVEPSDEGVIVGTGFSGEVWRFVSAGGARLAALDAVQVTAVLDGGRIVMAQGPSQLFVRADDGREGRYRSAVKTLERPARWGRYEVMPPAAGRLRFRQGATDPPDATWSEWSDWRPATSGQVPLGPSTNMQWELELSGSSSTTEVDRVQLAYREVNLAPVIRSVEVDEPGVIYLSGPPPSERIVEVSNPDINGIFSVIGDREPSSQRKGKKYWRVGYRTVAWDAEDVNGDALRFDLNLARRDGGPELPVRTALEQTQLGVDVSALPDGWYRFVVSATDAATNPGSAATVYAASAWFMVDNTPPQLSLERSRDGAGWRVTARDVSSPLLRAEWSRDGEGWSDLAPVDGLLDEPDEEFELELVEGEHLLVVRVVDRHHNRTVAGAVED